MWLVIFVPLIKVHLNLCVYIQIPPKPAPKVSTKPEAFQLQSLVRHEEEVQKQMEERERMEKEETRNRIFKAALIMKEYFFSQLNFIQVL